MLNSSSREIARTGRHFFLAAAFLLAGVAITHAQTNLGSTDDASDPSDPSMPSPILGYDTSDFSTLGTNYTHNGHLNYIADGNLSTAEDTYGHDTADNYSFVGFTFASPPATVTSLTLNFRLDGDGGWFGVSGSVPTNGQTLGDGYLTEPTLQITTNGTTWTTVSDTSNYLSDTTGLGDDTASHDPDTNSQVTKTITFTLDTPATDVEGIRLIGRDGGTAGAFDGVATDGGFIAIAEEDVYGTAAVPEPSTYALIGLGVLLLIGSGRLRKLSVLA